MLERAPLTQHSKALTEALQPLTHSLTDRHSLTHSLTQTDSFRMLVGLKVWGAFNPPPNSEWVLHGGGDFGRILRKVFFIIRDMFNARGKWS